MRSVSAIVVGHNSRELLERSLGSLVGLSGDDVEPVLVDNASSDGTADFVRARFPACRVLEAGSNLGFGRACNLAASETASEHLLLLNPDAWLDPGCVTAMRRAMAADARLAWAAPRLVYPGGRSQFIWGPTISILGEALQHLRNRFERRPWTHALLPRLVRALGDPGWFSAACALIRRRAWEDVGGFDEGFFLYFEDSDLGLRLRRAGWRLRQVDTALAYHDRHGPSASADRLARYRESQLRYYRKHRPAWENRLLLRMQTRRASRIADETMRARVLDVCVRARKAFVEGVVDLPEVNPFRAPATSPPAASATPASRS